MTINWTVAKVEDDDEGRPQPGVKQEEAARRRLGLRGSWGPKGDDGRHEGNAGKRQQRDREADDVLQDEAEVEAVHDLKAPTHPSPVVERPPPAGGRRARRPLERFGWRRHG